MLRVGLAILKGSNVKDSNIPILMVSTGINVYTSAGVR